MAEEKRAPTVIQAAPENGGIEAEKGQQIQE